LEIPYIDLDKSAIQKRLWEHIVARATSTPVSHAGAPPVLAAVDPDPVVSDPVAPIQELYSPLRQGYPILQPQDVQSLDSADQSSGVIQFRQDQLRQAEFKPSGQGWALPQYSDASSAELQLQL